MQQVLQYDQSREFEEFHILTTITTTQVFEQEEVFDQNHLHPGAQPQLNRKEVHHQRAQIPADVH